MAGQGPSRRELLEALGLASAASVFAGFSRWNYALGEKAQQHGMTPHAPLRTAYHPEFFTAAEYIAVEVLADLILPSTHSAPASSRSKAHLIHPGAKEAGVAEFIDFMVASNATLQAPFRDGLSWIDKASAPDASFAALTPAKQSAILERLAYKAKHQDSELTGQQFFRLFRKYTVMGFYTTRIGLESLDYPGLTFYATSPGCTHDGNPEHVGL